MPGITPPRILPTHVSSAPPPQQTSSLKYVGLKAKPGGAQTGIGPIDFTGIGQRGLLRGVYATHHLDKGLNRALRKMLPGGSNSAAREALKRTITENISKTGTISRFGLRSAIRSLSYGSGRTMTNGQVMRVLTQLGMKNLR